jgi:hypothetical protein
MTAAERIKLAGVETGATADQTDSEIATAYNNQVSAASQAEMEAGTETGIRRVSPLRVAQAIAALGGGYSFETINTPAGTDPVAESSTDTLNLTSADSSITITGTSGTDTVDFAVNEANVDHDSLFGFVANEHINWTSTSSNFSTTGTLACGAFTSTGIDDDATARRLHVRDADVLFGASGVDYLIRMNPNDRFLSITGGTNTSNGGQVLLYGATHASLASDIRLRSDTADVGTYDKSASEWNWQSVPFSAVGDLACDKLTSSHSGAVNEFVLERTDTHGVGQIGKIRYLGRAAGGSAQNYGEMIVLARDDTNSSEDGEYSFSTSIAGTLAARMRIAHGVWGEGSTGTDQGSGTSNWTTVYDDSVDVTCMVMEYSQTGKFDDIDIARWDEKVPDQIIPEYRTTAEVTERVEIEQDVVEPDETGKLVKRRKRLTVEQRVMDIVPIFDEDGNEIEVKRVPRRHEIVISEQRIERQHQGARMFKAMLDDGFDPRDPLNYLKKMKQDRALPGMLTQDEWTSRHLRGAAGEQGQKVGVGEMHNRTVFAVECLALAFEGLAQKVEKLEKGQR